VTNVDWTGERSGQGSFQWRSAHQGRAAADLQRRWGVDGEGQRVESDGPRETTRPWHRTPPRCDAFSPRPSGRRCTADLRGAARRPYMLANLSNPRATQDGPGVHGLARWRDRAVSQVCGRCARAFQALRAWLPGARPWGRRAAGARLQGDLPVRAAGRRPRLQARACTCAARPVERNARCFRPPRPSRRGPQGRVMHRDPAGPDR